MSQSTNRAERRRRAERAAEVRRAQAKKEQRRRSVVVTTVVLVVLAVVVGVGYAIQSGRDTTGQEATAPTGAYEEYGVPRGSADAPVTVTIFEDFMCPVCRELESLTSPWLLDAVASGQVRVVYRPVAFLNRFSNGTEYSTRATSAYAAVLDDGGPEVAAAFHDLLFENQPEEGSDGLSDSRLIDLAVSAGADRATVAAAVEDRSFEQWSDNATDRASRDKVTGTPTVEVNGTRLDPMTIPQLDQALRAAVAEARP